MKNKLIKWSLFCVLFPFVPLWILLGMHLLAELPVDFMDLIVLRGTLLALAVGLSIGAMGELVSSIEQWSGYEMTALAISVANAMAAVAFYAFVASYEPESVGAAVGLSLLCYVVAIATGAWCVILTARRRS